MLVFWGEGEPEYPEQNLSEQGENQPQTQPTYDAGSGNWTRAKLVEGESSHHWATLAPPCWILLLLSFRAWTLLFFPTELLAPSFSLMRVSKLFALHKALIPAFGHRTLLVPAFVYGKSTKGIAVYREAPIVLGKTYSFSLKMKTEKNETKTSSVNAQSSDLLISV